MVCRTYVLWFTGSAERLLLDVQVLEPKLYGCPQPGGVFQHLQRGRTTMEREFVFQRTMWMLFDGMFVLQLKDLDGM
jgi:hypothetical protein